MFFANEDNSKILAAFLKKAGALHTASDVQNFRLGVAVDLIGRMYKNPNDWDEKCKFNIEHIGEHFLRRMQNFDVDSDDIDHIYISSYRFLCELDFLIGEGRELSMELSSTLERVHEDMNSATGTVRSQLMYASYSMPISIAKELVNDSSIGVIKSFYQTKAEALKLKEQWDDEIEAKKVEVGHLKDKLDEYKVAFNFVGLHQGFSELSSAKKVEGKSLFLSLLGLGGLILAPLLAEMFFVMSIGMRELDAGYLFLFVPLISIEVILIYFFRIVLLNHRSVKAQIMQIELRMTLCQFIQSYADYSAKIKVADSVALEKFESLIFSGILTDPEKLPSTFDGIAQISSFIKNIKSS
ncbi:hypothetical protein DXU77_25680 [Pseudomonas lactis]|uniref:hypothetical protein n=1 Tax=Pseudomonas lactis TaxID=1615674 RepID=UPI0006465A8D|nr:hypothetical protein [Pseudomonas lactis]MQB18416.1 hypothetical protein [Pseudomonas lactis]